MVALLQRVSHARVEVDGVRVAAIDAGLLVLLCAAHRPVEPGQFGADMQVSLTNDGPVTFWLQVKPR